MKIGEVVKIDWVRFEENLNKSLDDEIKKIHSEGMSPNHPWITGMRTRFDEILKHRGETAEILGSYDYKNYINLKFKDGFEFGCWRKFLYI